jgi:hypothetical protein
VAADGETDRTPVSLSGENRAGFGWRGAEVRFAFADPPYIGQAQKHYGCPEVNHPALIERLVAEPVIWRGGRKRDRTEDTVRDWVSANITLKKGLSGAKPPAFCDWVFDLLGATDDDTLDDLFPGTGVVTARWNARQYDLSERAPVYEHPEWPDGFGGAQ